MMSNATLLNGTETLQGRKLEICFANLISVLKSEPLWLPSYGFYVGPNMFHLECKMTDDTFNNDDSDTLVPANCTWLNSSSLNLIAAGVSYQSAAVGVPCFSCSSSAYCMY